MGEIYGFDCQSLMTLHMVEEEDTRPFGCRYKAEDPQKNLPQVYNVCLQTRQDCGRVYSATYIDARVVASAMLLELSETLITSSSASGISWVTVAEACAPADQH